MRTSSLILSLVLMSSPLAAQQLYDVRWAQYANERLFVLYACVDADRIPAQYHDRTRFEGLMEQRVQFIQGAPRREALGSLLMGLRRGSWHALIGEQCLPTFMSAFDFQARQLRLDEADLVITEID